MPLIEDLTFTSDLIDKTPVDIDDIPTDYMVILGYHGLPIDMPSTLRQIYGQADVVLHEQIGWQSKEVEIYNRLSHATEAQQPRVIEAARPLHFNKPLSMKRLRNIAGTRAGHSFWDIPFGHPAFERLAHGRTLVAQSPDEIDIFTSAIIEADQLALASLGKRIQDIQPRSFKGEKRSVVIHAGMAHVLLYNALRSVTQSGSDSTTSLYIPFDHAGAGLEDQLPAVIETVAAVSGQELDETAIRRNMFFNKIDISNTVQKAATHKYAEAIWQVVQAGL